MRTVVEQPNFADDLDGYRQVYAEMEDVYESLCFTLAENPRQGTPLREAPSFRLYKTKSAGQTPAFWILFTFDSERVYLHSIEPMRDVQE